MYVCMYVCMYVLYMYIYIYLYVYTYVNTYIDIYVDIHLYIYICIYIYVYIYTHVYTYMYTYIPYRTVSCWNKDDSSIVLFFNRFVATYPPHGSQPGTAWHRARIPTLPSAPLQRSRC